MSSITEHLVMEDISIIAAFSFALEKENSPSLPVTG